MKNIKFSILFVWVFLLCLLLPQHETDAKNTYEGKCGPNAYWKYDKNSNTLTITGTGEMTSCAWMDDDDIPDYMEKAVIAEGITSICHSAFSPESAERDVFLRKGITLPSTIRSIGDYAFAYSDLEKINIPNAEISMGKGVFKGSNLSAITIPEGTTRIEAETFMECRNLEAVKLPSTVTYIGDCAYAESGLEELVLPDHVKELGAEVFRDCYSLKKASLSGITNLPSGTFDSCHILKKVTLSGNMTAIGDRAFQFCGKLETIDFPDGLRSVGEKAFSYCLALKKLRLPDTVTTIGKKMMADCVSLKKITLSKNLSVIGEGAFSDCISLKAISIPDSVEKIKKNAFEDCASLTKLIIPRGVKEILPCHQNCPKLHKIINNSNTAYSLSASKQVMNWYCGKKKVKTVKAGETVTGKGKVFRITYDRKMLKKYKFKIKGKLPSRYTYGKEPKLPQNITCGKKQYCFIGWRYQSSKKKFRTGAVRTWYGIWTKKFSPGVKGNLTMRPMVCNWKIDFIDKKEKQIAINIKKYWKLSYKMAEIKEYAKAISGIYENDDLEFQIRYADNKKMKHASSYTTREYGDLDVYNAKKGKTYYVQFCIVPREGWFYGIPYKTCWSQKIKVKMK